MNIIRVDEILLRRSASGLAHVIAPAVPAHEESVLGRPFGFICINVPRTPQVDALVADVENVIERAYSRNTMRPGQTPEQFFEETAAKVRVSIAGSLSEAHIKIDPSLMTIVLACVVGTDIFITRHGQAEAYLIRRVPGYPTKTIDIFRGINANDDERLLSDLIVGSITPDDLFLVATDSLFEAYPIADLVDATDRSEPAAVAARIRSIILSAPGNDAIAGCLMRLAPVRAMFRAKENPSVSALRSREEEVARTLSPSGVPGIGSFLERFKRKENKPRKVSLPKQKAPIIERFNNLPKITKLAAITALALVAIFIVSLKLVSVNNERKSQDAQFTTAVEAINKQIDLAESTLIYDEGRAKLILDEANSMINGLSNRNKREETERADLAERLTATQRALEHRYDATAKTLTVLESPASFIMRQGNDWLLNSGNDLLLINDIGSPTNLATLPDTPVWAASAQNSADDIYLWLKNGTLVSIGAKATDLPRALDYSGPTNPQSGAIWNNRLYVLDGEGKQIWRLPPTLTGFGKGATWLASPITGDGAISIAIDGKIYTAIPGDAIRKFEKGGMSPFAASGASANTNPLSIVLGESNIYLLGNDNTIAVWNEEGKLLAQYTLPSDLGKTTAFLVDEAHKKVIIATDKGIIADFDLVK